MVLVEVEGAVLYLYRLYQLIGYSFFEELSMVLLPLLLLLWFSLINSLQRCEVITAVVGIG